MNHSEWKKKKKKPDVKKHFCSIDLEPLLIWNEKFAYVKRSLFEEFIVMKEFYFRIRFEIQYEQRTCLEYGHIRSTGRVLISASALQQTIWNMCFLKWRTMEPCGACSNSFSNAFFFQLKFRSERSTDTKYYYTV